MEEEKLLQLIEYKFKLMKAQEKHEKEVEECDDYRYNEGYVSKSMKDIRYYEEKIKSLLTNPLSDDE
jgi:hypothetical protein